MPLDVAGLGGKTWPTITSMTAAACDVTALLRAWTAGDAVARDRLIEAVFHELRQRAAARLRREPRPQRLDATELVHEAYLRLVDQRRVVWQNRSHFFAIASQLMRRILVDRARAHRRPKRSGCWARTPLEEHVRVALPRAVDGLDLDVALADLAVFDARKAQLAELRFFGGLSLEEAGEALGISVATAERD
jgi:RNA polymerase sigma factor (TIGR02999 family)